MGAVGLEPTETEVEGFTVSQLSNIYKKLQHLTIIHSDIYRYFGSCNGLQFTFTFCEIVHHKCTIFTNAIDINFR
jgi:hypothetical protein